MIIRTYYWHRRVRPRWYLKAKGFIQRKQSRDFAVGNAGDILARDLLQQHYQVPVRNVESGGRRIMAVGSIGHKVETGDVICGIGVKSKELRPPPNAEAVVYGLRGPISYDAFSRAGFDMSNIRFLLDPGLLIGRLLSDQEADASEGPIFIPHYRERWRYGSGLPSGIKLVDIDATPKEVAAAILRSSAVYSSSLHGIVFAHALRRPCVYVKPQTDEGELKYEDYFASVGLTYRAPASDIFSAARSGTPSSPVDLAVDVGDICFPDVKILRANGVVEG